MKVRLSNYKPFYSNNPYTPLPFIPPPNSQLVFRIKGGREVRIFLWVGE